jgi:hypothetical protein
MTEENARQRRAEAWWAERERQYRRRPDVRQEIERVHAGVRRQIEEEEARLQRLEARADAGVPGAERALNEAYTWQAVQMSPPEPSAKDDPQEWSAFFRHEYGRDMPLNAEYEAEKHRIEAAAPADVGGMAAAYFEVNYPTGFDRADLEAEWCGVPEPELNGGICADQLGLE